MSNLPELWAFPNSGNDLMVVYVKISRYVFETEKSSY